MEVAPWQQEGLLPAITGRDNPGPSDKDTPRVEGDDRRSIVNGIEFISMGRQDR
jgi:hypothetical protein